MGYFPLARALAFLEVSPQHLGELAQRGELRYRDDNGSIEVLVEDLLRLKREMVFGEKEQRARSSKRVSKAGKSTGRGNSTVYAEPDAKGWVPVLAAARIAGVSSRSIWRWEKDGDLTLRRDSPCILVRLQDVLDRRDHRPRTGRFPHPVPEGFLSREQAAELLAAPRALLSCYARHGKIARVHASHADYYDPAQMGVIMDDLLAFKGGDPSARLITQREAAKRLGVADMTLRTRVLRGEMESFTLHGIVLFRVRDIDTCTRGRDQHQSHVSGFITQSEAARRLGLSVASVYLMVRDGKLSSQKSGHYVLLDESEVEALRLARQHRFRWSKVMGR